MLAEFSFLDYLWRGLFVGTLTSTVILLLMLVVSWFLRKKSSHWQMKWFFNTQLLLLSTIFAASFLWVLLGDAELATGCFNQFVKDSSSFTITRLVAAIWLIGVLAGVAIDFKRVFLGFTSSQKFKPLKNKNLQLILSQLQTRLKTGRTPVSLYTTSQNSSPFVWGLFKYKVIIPQKILDTLSPQALENILAHELIHVRDRDPLWILLELLCQRLMFFHPAIYYVGRQHLKIIEKAADEEAVKKGGVPAQGLLNSLLEVISLCQTSRSHALPPHASRGFYEIKERIESLAQVERAHYSSSFFHSCVIGSFVVSLGFSVAQAKMAVTGLNENPNPASLICTQLRHERIIESWLRIEPVPNKCE